MRKGVKLLDSKRLRIFSLYTSIYYLLLDKYTVLSWGLYNSKITKDNMKIVKTNDTILQIISFLHTPGIEPRTYTWKAYILPLNYVCCN